MIRSDIESRIPTSGLRSSLADDCHALNFNHDPRLREVGNSDQRAGGEFALREHLVAQFHELVAIPGIIDKDGHGHQVPEASSTALQGSVDQREIRPRLTLEVAHKRLAVQVRGGGLAREPNDSPASGNYCRGRKRAPFGKRWFQDIALRVRMWVAVEQR